MGERSTRAGVRSRALRGAIGAMAVLGVLAGPAPAGATAAVLDDRVAERRSTWEQAVRAVDEWNARVAELDEELTEAEAVEEGAAASLDTETALLVQRERELDDAGAALAAAEAAAAEAAAGLQRAIGAYERALEHARDRRSELGVAAASAYTNGDPRVQALDGVVHALDQSANVSEFLAATERLTYVTRDARTKLDGAAEDLEERGGDALVAANLLGQRRNEEAAALQARDSAEAAAEAQRERHAVAVAAHDEAVAAVEQLRTDLAGAVEALDVAQAALAAEVAALHGLGWYAGVPGPHGLVWPTDGRPGSGFGPRMHPIHGVVRPHQGVDVGAPTGQPVVAAAEGRVVHAGPRGGYGITVVLDHGDELTTLYAHLSALDVRRGDEVAEAQLIGRIGSTGQSTGPHLHFEVRKRGAPQDPLRFYR